MNPKLTIVADAHIWGVELAFSSLPGYQVNLRVLESKHITSHAVRDADILLTRSSTQVDADLLAASAVRFAATATIGDDHYDKSFLNRQGIAFANAAGSSTASVIEYMITALLHLHGQGLISIPETTMGIIGVGRIGSVLAQKCSLMGMKVLLHDPPRARTEGGDTFSTLGQLLDQADILTLHTPLIRDGEDKTTHLLNESRLQHFHGRGIINTARGACLDNRALYAWLNDNPACFAALDCWEHEPAPATELLGHPQVVIATPHIAGHSLDGKAANTWYVYRALCDWLGVQTQWTVQQELPPPAKPVDLRCMSDPLTNMLKAAEALYPLHQNHAMMKSWVSKSDTDMAHTFTAYRRHYPVRRGWEHAPLHLIDADKATLSLAHAIGLRTV